MQNWDFGFIFKKKKNGQKINFGFKGTILFNIRLLPFGYFFFSFN